MNWGYKITFVYIAFVIGMLTLVFKARSEKVELVADDYYAQELAYEQRIDAIDNARALSSSVDMKQAQEGVLLHFPAEVPSNVTGEIMLYRPSNSALDLCIPLQLNDSKQQLIPSNKLSGGLYTVKVSWTMNDQKYYVENAMVIQ